MKRRRPVQVKKSLNIRMILSLTACMVLVAALSIGGTLAWLQTSTGPVVNTFTAGDIAIELKEHDYDPSTGLLGTTEVTSESDYKIVPGKNLPKDPFVRFTADSEPCWLFVQVDPSDNWPAKMTWAIDEGWTLVEENVYVKQYDTVVTANTEVNILKDQTVTVSSELTKAELNALTSNPTLTFKAFAVQKEAAADAAAAWAQVPTADKL